MNDIFLIRNSYLVVAGHRLYYTTRGRIYKASKGYKGWLKITDDNGVSQDISNKARKRYFLPYKK